MNKIIKSQLKLFFRFIKLLLPYRGKWLAILVLSSTGAVFGLINPYISKLVIDKGIVAKDARAFTAFVLLGVLVFILNSAINGFQQFLDNYIGYKVNFDLNRQVFRCLQHLPLSYFKDRSSGEHLYRVNNDINAVTDFITTTPPQAVSIFPKLFLTLVIVFYLNWEMALLSLILTPFLYLPIYYFTKKMRVVWKSLIEHYESIFKGLNEIFSNMYMIKAFGRENASAKKYLKILITNIKIRKKHIKLNIYSGLASGALNKILLGFITFYGGYQAIKGKMSLGSLAAIMVYLGQLMGLQNNFAHFFRTIALGLVSCKRVEEILDADRARTNKGAGHRVNFTRGDIVFKDINFGYNKNNPILTNFNLRIEGGSYIAFAGPSGCGKTTLINLVLRLYEPWSGDIFIDGYSIKDIDTLYLKEQLGVALQEPFLLNDTVFNNIRYARENAGRDAVSKIARICCADDFILALPNGYDTVIGENACKISEGQKQRIALARALIKEPKVLMVDEAFSSVDYKTEAQIMLNIKEHCKDMAMIVVSHRQSIVGLVDKVYDFKKGY